MKTKIWLLIGLVVVFAAMAIIIYSSDRPTSAVVPFDRDKFVALYVDLEILAEKAGIGTPPYEVQRDSILNSYGLTFDQVTRMLGSYDTKPEEWAKVWDEILAELKRRKPAATTDTASAD